MLPGFKIGVYGGGNGSAWPPYLPQITTFLGRPPDFAVVFTDFSSKQGFRNDGTWAPGYYKGTVGTVVVRLPLLCADDANFQSVISGAYDADIIAVASAWKVAGFTAPGALYADIGWESNGGWYPSGNLDGPNQAQKIAAWALAWQHFAAVWKSVLPNSLTGLSLAGGNQQVGWTDLTNAQPTPGKLSPSMGLQWLGCDHYGQGLPFGQVDPALADYQRYAMQGEQFDGWVAGSATQLGWLRWWAGQLGLPYALWEFAPCGDRPDGSGNQIGTGDNPACFAWIESVLTAVPSGTGPGELIGVGWWDNDMPGTGGYSSVISDGRSHPLTAAAVKGAWGAPAAPPVEPDTAALMAEMKVIEAKDDAISALIGTPS